MNKDSSSDPSDALLVAQAKAGYLEAFGQLYVRYVDPIYRYVHARLGEQQDAEDLTEEVFLRSFLSLDRYRERGWPFSAFLYQVARNAVTDHFRKNRVEADASESESMASAVQSPDDHLVREERLRDIRKAVDELAPNYREVIILRVMMSLPTATVAKWTNSTEDAVRVMLYRAMESVRGRFCIE
jgi:RNA polymerase sigma-70 factor (ECF subfamily)